MDSSAITLLNQSRQNYKRGDIEKAMSLLKELLEISRNDKEVQSTAYFEIGKIYTDINKDDSAIKFFQKAISIYPEILIQEHEWLQSLKMKNNSFVYSELERTQAEFKDYLIAQTKSHALQQKKYGLEKHIGKVANPQKKSEKTAFTENQLMDGNVKYAGFWKRFVATIIDCLVFLFVNLILFVILVYGFGVTFAAFSIPTVDKVTSLEVLLGRFIGYIVWYLVSAIIWWLYYAIMESSSCRGTLGKMLLGIYVIDEFGNRIGIGRATGRYFLKVVLFTFSIVPYLIGCLMIPMTRRKQAWHDMPVGCLVLSK